MDAFFICLGWSWTKDIQHHSTFFSWKKIYEWCCMCVYSSADPLLWFSLFWRGKASSQHDVATTMVFDWEGVFKVATLFLFFFFLHFGQKMPGVCFFCVLGRGCGNYQARRPVVFFQLFCLSSKKCYGCTTIHLSLGRCHAFLVDLEQHFWWVCSRPIIFSDNNFARFLHLGYWYLSVRLRTLSLIWSVVKSQLCV